MFKRGAPIPDVYHAWLNSLFGAGVAWVIFGVSVILYAYTTATATAPPSILAISWGGVFVAVGLCCWIAIYPVWRMGRRSADAAAARSGMDALEEWKRDLTRRPQRIEIVGATGGAARAAAAYDETMERQRLENERLARILADSPPTADEMTPYRTAFDLRELRQEGNILRIVGDDDAAWRERVRRMLPPPYLTEFRLGDLRESVELLGRAVDEMEAALPVAERVGLLDRLVKVGRRLQLKMPRADGEFYQNPIFSEWASWGSEIEIVLPVEWRLRWKDERFKNAGPYDFDSQLGWLSATMECLQAESQEAANE